MGQLGAPFGVQGWVKVHPYTEQPASLLDYPHWWLRATSEEEWLAANIEAVQMQGATLIVKFADCPVREQAALRRGWQIGVERAALPPARDNEYYWADLIDREVVNKEGIRFGRVREVLRTGANDVLVVASAEDRRERLIPFIETAICTVDGGTIIVDWGADW